jgi:phospholipid/cholesterol/gamma-HCH transport system substrate-binding protein
LKGLTTDARSAIRRADAAVGSVQGEMANLKGFVADGRDTLRSVKQGTDAIGKMPVIRSYVEDSAGLLVRPTMRRDRQVFPAGDLFLAKTAILTETGVGRLDGVVEWLASVTDARADVVVVAFSDPRDPDQTSASALEMTRKQAEVTVEFFRSRGLHKLGWTTRRKMTPLGMGQSPSPVVESERLPGSNLQVLLFSPP